MARPAVAEKDADGPPRNPSSARSVFTLNADMISIEPNSMRVVALGVKPRLLSSIPNWLPQHDLRRGMERKAERYIRKGVKLPFQTAAKELGFTMKRPTSPTQHSASNIHTGTYMNEGGG
jgi:hypothetical protein